MGKDISKETKLSFDREVRQLSKAIKKQYRKTWNVWNKPDKRLKETEKLEALQKRFDELKSRQSIEKGEADGEE